MCINWFRSASTCLAYLHAYMQAYIKYMHTQNAYNLRLIRNWKMRGLVTPGAGTEEDPSKPRNKHKPTCTYTQYLHIYLLTCMPTCLHTIHAKYAYAILACLRSYPCLRMPDRKYRVRGACSFKSGTMDSRVQKCIKSVLTPTFVLTIFLAQRVHCKSNVIWCDDIFLWPEVA